MKEALVGIGRKVTRLKLKFERETSFEGTRMLRIHEDPSENTYSRKVCDSFNNVGTNLSVGGLALSVSRLLGRAFSGPADSRLQSRVYIRLSAVHTWSLFRACHDINALSMQISRAYRFWKKGRSSGRLFFHFNGSIRDRSVSHYNLL